MKSSATLLGSALLTIGVCSASATAGFNMFSASLQTGAGQTGNSNYGYWVSPNPTPAMYDLSSTWTLNDQCVSSASYALTQGYDGVMNADAHVSPWVSGAAIRSFGVARLKFQLGDSLALNWSLINSGLDGATIPWLHRGSIEIIAEFEDYDETILDVNLSDVGLYSGGLTLGAGIYTIALQADAFSDFRGSFETTGSVSFSTGVPAPGAIALLGLSGLVARRRRR